MQSKSHINDCSFLEQVPYIAHLVVNKECFSFFDNLYNIISCLPFSNLNQEEVDPGVGFRKYIFI